VNLDDVLPDVPLFAGQLVADDALEATLVPPGRGLPVVENPAVHQPRVAVLKKELIKYLSYLSNMYYI
jgi:hypothetical protein